MIQSTNNEAIITNTRRNSPYEFFTVSSKLIHSLKESISDVNSWTCRFTPKITEKNQAALSYALFPGERGQFGKYPTDFLESRGAYLLIFVIEFDEKNSLAKLVREPIPVLGKLSVQ
jgi:hypothetical protein